MASASCAASTRASARARASPQSSPQSSSSARARRMTRGQRHANARTRRDYPQPMPRAVARSSDADDDADGADDDARASERGVDALTSASRAFGRNASALAESYGGGRVDAGEDVAARQLGVRESLLESEEQEAEARARAAVNMSRMLASGGVGRVEADSRGYFAAFAAVAERGGRRGGVEAKRGRG